MPCISIVLVKAGDYADNTDGGLEDERSLETLQTLYLSS